MKNRNNPWMTKDIVKLMYKRDYIKTKSGENNDENLRKEHRTLRNKVTNLCRQAKKDYYYLRLLEI